jgi:hypothetical protein
VKVPDVEQDRALLERAREWCGSSDVPTLDRASVGAILEREGIEFSTALVFQALRARHAQLIQRVENAGAVANGDALIAIVPGAFYREHRHTSADGARVVEIARAMGLRAEVVPIPSLDTLDHNAAVLMDWLRARRGERIFLVSLSKGSADVRVALESAGAPEAFAAVAAWVSLSGMLTGTPLLQWLAHKPLHRLGIRLVLAMRGQQLRSVDELSSAPGTRLGAPLAHWPRIRVIHVLGCPLRHHLRHRWAPRAYERLAPLGPNDGGGILLSEALHWPGEVHPVWGVDHYMNPSWDIAPLLASILAEAVRTPREANLQTNQSQASASATPATRSTA